MKNLLASVVAFFAIVSPTWGGDDVLLIQDKANAVYELETIADAPRPEIELLYFGYYRKGFSEECDSIRDVIDEATRKFPIERIYFDKPSGRRQFESWRVEDVPAFILVRNEPKGPVEIRRWHGADGDVYSKIERAFKSSRYNPPPRITPPPSRITPPPRVVPPPPPRIAPPPRKPVPPPRPWWHRFFSF